MEMKSYKRLKELREELSSILQDRYIEVSSDDSISSLVKKVKSSPLYIEKGASIVPTSPQSNPKVTYPALNDPIRGMESSYGVIYDEENKRFVNAVTDVNKKSWPHFSVDMSGTTVKVNGCRLQVDIECSQFFNMSVWYKGYLDDTAQQAWLDNVAGVGNQDGFVDFPGPRISGTYNFGNYIIHREETDKEEEMGVNHVGAPKVSSKVNLLQKALETVGKNIDRNYKFNPKEHTYGQYLLGDMNASDGSIVQINLSETPYLYYSVEFPDDVEKDAGEFTFGIYNKEAWLLLRDGRNTSSDTLLTKGSDFNLGDYRIKNSQTGCIDLRKFVSGDTFTVNGMKLYGGMNTNGCTINYMFFGSAPTRSVDTSKWGSPATPDAPILDFPALCGEVEIERIDYYVVGEGSKGDWIKINDVTFAYDNS